MSPATSIAMYLVIWWTVLFAVLPIGTRPQAAPDAQSGWRGAPERPGIGKKALITTVIATAFWLLAYWLITSPWISFRTGWLALPSQ